MTGSAAREAVHASALNAALIDRAVAGDRDAFDALIQPRLAATYRTAFAILRHEADARDAVQDASVQAWRQLGRLREPDRFDAWLGRILLNVCRAQLRSRRRIAIREIDVAIAEEGDKQRRSNQSLLDHRIAEADAVRRAFLRLGAGDRVLLALHHAEQRPVHEIATMTGSPVGTVKWRLHRARQALAKALERER